jgi:hypothetical protein
MRRLLPALFPTLAVWAVMSLAACSGGGNSVSKVQEQVITPCFGPIATFAIAETTPTIIPAFDVWQAIFAPGTPRPTATSTPTFRTPPAIPATPAPTATPEDRILFVSVDTGDQNTASQFRLTVACQGTVVVPATFDGMLCTFPPPGPGPDVCPKASINLNQLGFADQRHVACLIEVGPGEPLGFGTCSDPDRAGYKLTITLNNQAANSLTLAAHNCRPQGAAQSCLQDVFGIAIPTTTPTVSEEE